MWCTCRCTEDDQRRREREIRDRNTRLEAQQRAEEEEMRRARVAIEAAERRLREEQEAEERRMQEEERELARLEEERLKQITVWFEYLRKVLESVRLQQVLAIKKRHQGERDAIEDMREEVESPARVAERDAVASRERDKIVANTQNTVKSLQRQHATVMMETIGRHREDQDYFTSRYSNSDEDTAIIQAETLQKLMSAQDLERSTLMGQQAREMQKWKSRGEACLQEFDAKMLSLQLRLEEMEKIDRHEEDVMDMIFADAKWTDLLFETRVAMLQEDEKKMVQKGGEASKAPDLETIVMPEDTSPILGSNLPSPAVPNKSSKRRGKQPSPRRPLHSRHGRPDTQPQPPSTQKDRSSAPVDGSLRTLMSSQLVGLTVGHALPQSASSIAPTRPKLQIPTPPTQSQEAFTNPRSPPLASPWATEWRQWRTTPRGTGSLFDEVEDMVENITADAQNRSFKDIPVTPTVKTSRFSLRLDSANPGPKRRQASKVSPITPPQPLSAPPEIPTVHPGSEVDLITPAPPKPRMAPPIAPAAPKRNGPACAGAVPVTTDGFIGTRVTVEGGVAGKAKGKGKDKGDKPVRNREAEALALDKSLLEKTYQKNGFGRWV